MSDHDAINAKLDEIDAKYANYTNHHQLITALRLALEALKAYRLSPSQSLREHAEACERDIAKILGCKQ